MKTDEKCTLFTKKNISFFVIISIIVTFFFYLKYNWEKKWKESWNRWKTSIKNEENNIMSILKIVSIVITIIILPAIAYFIFSVFKTKKHKEVIRQPFEEKKNEVIEPFSVQWERLFKQKSELEQKMAKLVSGGSGMVVLRDKLNNISGDDQGIDMYRESYQNKQKKLKEYYVMYCDVMKKAELLPENAGDHFAPLRNEKLYQELLEYSCK